MKSIRGGRCQARWVLIDVVTALMETGSETQYVKLLLAHIGEEGVDINRKESVSKWFGLRTKIGQVETNRLYLAFVSLVKGFTEAPRTFRQA